MVNITNLEVESICRKYGIHPSYWSYFYKLINTGIVNDHGFFNRLAFCDNYKKALRDIFSKSLDTRVFSLPPNK
jgi:hypothetical protein